MRGRHHNLVTLYITRKSKFNSSFVGWDNERNKMHCVNVKAKEPKKMRAGWLY